MPKIEHEFLTELFQNDPGLAVEFAAPWLADDLPRYTRVTLQSNRVDKVDPPEMTADSVVLLRDPQRKRTVHGRPTDAVAGIITEVQRCKDDDKRLTWPCYVTNLRYRIDAPVALLVLCPNRGMAGWSRNTIATGHPGFDLAPIVLGPDEVPVVDDPAAFAESPELGVLSTLVHAEEDEALVDVMMEGLDKIARHKAATYTGFAMVLLAEAPRHRLEEIMESALYGFTSPFTERYVEQGRSEGRAEGRAEAAEAAAKVILKALSARGIAVTSAARDRIMNCTDPETLERWGDRAFTVSSVEELFD